MKTLVYNHSNGNRLFRGKRPSSKYEIEDLNVKTIINLETGWFEFLHHESRQESEWCKSLDLSIAHLPLSNFSTPTIEQVKKFLSFVDNALNCGDVYFHCLHGVDRTGYMAACFRILRQGWENEAAVLEMLSMGFHVFPYHFWIESLIELKST